MSLQSVGPASDRAVWHWTMPLAIGIGEYGNDLGGFWLEGYGCELLGMRTLIRGGF